MGAVSDPSRRPQFYRDLAKAEFFVVAEGKPQSRTGESVQETGHPLEVREISWEGKNCIPVYSSLQRLEADVGEQAGVVAVNAIEFMQAFKGANLVLNPGGEYGKELLAEEVASIIDGSIWRPSEVWVAEEPQQVMIGRPANYPNELVAALSRHFGAEKSVKRAFLALYYNPNRDEKPHTLIAIEFDGEWDPIMAEAGIVANGVQVPDPPIEFMPITGTGGLEEYFLKESKPFYRRRLFGLF